MQGTAPRKHAKQKFVRNNFADMHNKVKNVKTNNTPRVLCSNV